MKYARKLFPLLFTLSAPLLLQANSQVELQIGPNTSHLISLSKTFMEQECEVGPRATREVCEQVGIPDITCHEEDDDDFSHDGGHSGGGSGGGIHCEIENGRRICRRGLTILKRRVCESTTSYQTECHTEDYYPTYCHSVERYVEGEVTLHVKELTEGSLKIRASIKNNGDIAYQSLNQNNQLVTVEHINSKEDLLHTYPLGDFLPFSRNITNINLRRDTLSFEMGRSSNNLHIPIHIKISKKGNLLIDETIDLVDTKITQISDEISKIEIPLSRFGFRPKNGKHHISIDIKSDNEIIGFPIAPFKNITDHLSIDKNDWVFYLIK